MHPAYFHTVFDADTPPGGWPQAWAVLTAHAPTGKIWSFAANAEADARLRDHLVELGLPHWRVTGRSPEGDHAEPGFGVAMKLPAAKSLGRAFSQKAIYWVQDGDLWVGDCSACGPFVRVGALSPKLNPPPTDFPGRARLAAACRGDAVRLAAVLRFLGAARDRPTHLDALTRDADDSDYPLPAWCEAAAEFQNRLEQAGRASPFAKKLGYLNCCAEAQSSIPMTLRPSLPESFAAMWEQFGYTG